MGDEVSWLDDNMNSVVQGDCLEILKEIPDNSVDLIVTDPPYGIAFKSNRTNHQAEIQNDKLDDYLLLIDKTLPEMKRVLVADGCCCCCCGGGGGKTPVTAIFTLEAIKHFALIQTLVWDKMSFGLGWKYRPEYENILVLANDKDKYKWYGDANVSNILRYPKIIPQRGEHPTVKPADLMGRLISLHSEGQHLILDPFAGSGTTLVAAKQLGRRYIGIEIEPKYVEIARTRLAQEVLAL